MARGFTFQWEEEDGFVNITWTNPPDQHHPLGTVEAAELDAESADVKEMVALGRKIIWGE